MTKHNSHWLRPNHTNRFPRRFIYIDSEAIRHHQRGGERHTFRIASAGFDVISNRTLEPARSDFQDFDNPADLWSWVDSKTVPRQRTILWALNLSYDLRLTQCFLILPSLGWRFEAGSFAGNRSCWAQWKRDGRSLVMADLFSFVPKSLAKIAFELNLQKKPLPEHDAPIDEWFSACRNHVEITRAGCLELVKWLEKSDLGSFRITGASQSSAAYRHRFMPQKKILIHSDENAREAERRAAWTGRCEVWKHGPTDELLHEWDYSLAYATIAQRENLPVQLLNHRPNFSGEDLGPQFRTLCEVEITTEKPTVPAEKDGKILWPVGTFETTLWDREIRLAVSEGAKVRYKGAWIYRAYPVLQDWANWIIDSLEGPDRETHPLGRIVIKSWSRSLIGRFGLRHPRWKDFATSPINDLLYLPYLDIDNQNHGVMFQVGTDVLEQADLSDSAESAPAIMSAIMAAGRIRLWATMRAIGFRNVYYVDTDSILVDSAANSKLIRLSKEDRFRGLRLKSSFQGADFRAPRNIMLGHNVRIAGVPKAARENSRGIFTGTVWQSISESLRSRSADSIAVRSRKFNTNFEDFRRAHLSDGKTGAFILEP